jgi:hypothetical protein
MKEDLIEYSKRLFASLKRHAADLDELANHCGDGERDHYRRKAAAVRIEAEHEETKLKFLMDDPKP